MFPEDCPPLYLKFTKLIYRMKEPPANDNIPSMMSALETELNIRMERITIGRSVMSGARAIKIPLILLPRRVSEMTRDNKGPGAIPAPRPRVMPYIKYSVILLPVLYLRAFRRTHNNVGNV
jgi:hypothetical protein